MKMSGWMPLLLLGIGWVGCTSSPPDNKDLEKEVLDIHDEAMLWMEDIAALQKEIRVIGKEAGITAPPALADQTRKHLVALEQADAVMWDWMHQYVKVTDRVNWSHEKEEAYLQDELVKVKEMRTLMRQNIDAAEVFLDNYQNPSNE